MGYISSSTFFRTSSGKPLRMYMAGKSQFETVIDFGDLQIFPGVTTYPVVLTCQKSVNRIKKPNGEFAFLKLQAPESSCIIEKQKNNYIIRNLPSCFEKSRQFMPQKRLGTGSWQLEIEELANLRKKIRGRHKSLKQAYDSPLYGIKTGLNEAFIIDRSTYELLMAADLNSAELLKPFLKGEDFEKWRIEGKDIWIIHIPKGWTSQQRSFENSELAWGWMEKSFPAIASHLAPFRERAEKRTDQGDYWWELRACSYSEKIESSKIVYQDVSNGSPFSLDTSGRYMANTGYFVPSGDRFLLTVLNSSVAWFYWIGMTTIARGGYLRLFTQYIETLPIPKVSKAEAANLITLAEQTQAKAEERYALEAAVRRRIPDLCPATMPCKLTKKLQNWPSLNFAAFQAEIKTTFKTEIPLAQRNDWQTYLETEAQKIQQLTREIALLEQDMNNRIYKLFKLTDEEIQLLEASLAGQV